MDYYNESLKLHEKYKGKWEVGSKVPIDSTFDLSLAYTPGVARPCLEIAKKSEAAYKYTAKWNTVAIVTDGSAALGLGNIGGMAALPIMEGKAILFKRFAGIDAVPICLDTQDTDEIVKIIKNIVPSFGGINLEDIAAPRCFQIEEKLQNAVDVPVFHDDQHGTAIVVLAAGINGAKLLGKRLEDMKVVVNGAGAAGIAITQMLRRFGVRDILVCDSRGIIGSNRDDLTIVKKKISSITNFDDIKGTLKEAIVGRDLFIGVSKPNVLTQDMVRNMADDPMIFAMANPEPEIMPELAKEAGAKIVGTGRSDFPNQINNLLAFPGVFRGTLDARAKRVTMEMKIAAAKAIANTMAEEDLAPETILPTVFNENVMENVANAVSKSWVNYIRKNEENERKENAT